MTKRHVVVARKLLEKRYGARDAKKIIAAVRPLATGSLVISKESTAVGIRADLTPHLDEDEDAGVLLVGGANQLPFFELTPNPAWDGDATVESDNPYGTLGDSVDVTDVYLPAFPVGRIPDHPDDTASTFVARLARLCAVRPAARSPKSSYFLSTASWRRASKSIAKAAGLARALDLSPPRQPADFVAAGPVAAGTTHFLFNLHGSDIAVPWMGETASQTSKPIAFDIGSATQLSQRSLVTGGVFVSQACFGAFIRNLDGELTPASRICLRLLEDGASAFLGSTTLAYGRSKGMGCSDVLVAEFTKAVLAGLSFGAALLRARRATATTHATPPSGTLLKTLLQFVLYGDPTGTWSKASGPLPKTGTSRPPNLRSYADWKPEFAQNKSSASRVAAVAVAAQTHGAASWVPLHSFVASSGSPDLPPKSPGVSKSAGGHRREMMLAVRSAGAQGDGASEPLAYFRERIAYADGRVDEVESTGGIAVRTLVRESTAAPGRAVALAAASRGARPRKTETLSFDLYARVGPTERGSRQPLTAQLPVSFEAAPIMRATLAKRPTKKAAKKATQKAKKAAKKATQKAKKVAGYLKKALKKGRKLRVKRA